MWRSCVAPGGHETRTALWQICRPRSSRTGRSVTGEARAIPGPSETLTATKYRVQWGLNSASTGCCHLGQKSMQQFNVLLPVRNKPRTLRLNLILFSSDLLMKSVALKSQQRDRMTEKNSVHLDQLVLTAAVKFSGCTLAKCHQNNSISKAKMYTAAFYLFNVFKWKYF